MKTPKDLGFRFPAEWHRHDSTWLSYPHNENSWPGKIDSIFPSYNRFIAELSKGERVNINIEDEASRERVEEELRNLKANLSNVSFHFFRTNDAWCRDHGPAFVIKANQKAIVDWDYNAWGGKYPCEQDNLIPGRIAEEAGFEVFRPHIVMEGGSIDVNGKGSLLTTTSCLLNKNRNPLLTQAEIEEKLCQYYNVDNVIWLGDGIEGDDTDGHIDDMTRFVNEDTVVTVVETDPQDENYDVLQQNLALLNKARLQDGKQLNVVELPMPSPVIWDDMRLPASYANFYIANGVVIVPTYRCDNDEKALCILESLFPDRRIVGIDSTDIIWGLGSFHCLSQQEPSLSE